MAINPTHVRLAAVATQQINKNGRAAILRKTTANGDPWNTPEPDVDQPVTVVATTNDRQDVAAGLIKANDITYLVDSAYDPNLFNMLVDGSKERHIAMVKTITPGETSILYKVTVTV